MLSLDRNKISKFDKKAFSQLTALVFVNLSNNPFEVLPTSLLTWSTEVKIISMKTLSLFQLDKKVFDSNKIKIVEASQFAVCCISPQHVHCTEDAPWYRSCSDLLVDTSVKVVTKVMSALLFLINVVCIFIHFLNITNKAYSAVVVANNISNVLFCGFLTMLWATDLFFSRTFIFQNHRWRSGPLCFSASGLHLFHSLTSAIFTAFLSFCRLMIVIHPFDTKMKRTKSVVKYIMVFVLIFCLLSLCLCLAEKFVYHGIMTELCILYVDPTKSVIIAKVLVWNHFCSHFFFIVAIAIMHVSISVKFQKSQMKIPKSTKDDTSKGLNIQLGILSTSTIICWIPESIIYVTLMFLPVYPIKFVAWTPIVVKAVNPILMPLTLCVYSIKSMVKEKSKKKDQEALLWTPVAGAMSCEH